jgi:3-hydroxyacyl-CoA dehydrogenase
MVARGDVGVRSGKGFYEWNGQDAADMQRRANERLQRLLTFLEREAQADDGDGGSGGGGAA